MLVESIREKFLNHSDLVFIYMDMFYILIVVINCFNANIISTYF